MVRSLSAVGTAVLRSGGAAEPGITAGRGAAGPEEERQDQEEEEEGQRQAPTVAVRNALRNGHQALRFQVADQLPIAVPPFPFICCFPLVATTRATTMHDSSNAPRTRTVHAVSRLYQPVVTLECHQE